MGRGCAPPGSPFWIPHPGGVPEGSRWLRPSAGATTGGVTTFCLVLLAAALLAACFGQEERPAEEGDNRRGSGPQAGKTIGAGGVEIGYTLYGEGDTLLVLAPGWGGSQADWSSQVDDLAQRYTLVTLDFGGHGASGRRGRADIAALARDLGAVLDAVSAKKAILVGHGLGGLAALEAAREKPAAVGAVIGVTAFTWPPPQPATWSELLGQLAADFPGACRTYVRGLFSVTTEEPLVDEMAEQVCRLDPDLASSLLASQSTYDLGKALAALPPSLPVRAIEASEEAEPPPLPTAEPQQKFHADYRSSQIARSGRYPMFEQSAELTRQLAAAIEEIDARP